MSREVIIQRIEKSDLIDAKKELMIDLVNSKKKIILIRKWIVCIVSFLRVLRLKNMPKNGGS